MTIWVAMLLGLVQGLCEFLPVSSSGHLLLLSKMFGITEGAMFFSVMLHLATLVAVLIVALVVAIWWVGDITIKEIPFPAVTDVDHSQLFAALSVMRCSGQRRVTGTYPVLRSPAARPLMVRWIARLVRSSVWPAR